MPTKGALNTRQAFRVHKDALAQKISGLAPLDPQDLPHGGPDLQASVALRGFEIRFLTVPHPDQFDVDESGINSRPLECHMLADLSRV